MATIIESNTKPFAQPSLLVTILQAGVGATIGGISSLFLRKMSFMPGAVFGASFLGVSYLTSGLVTGVINKLMPNSSLKPLLRYSISIISGMTIAALITSAAGFSFHFSGVIVLSIVIMTFANRLWSAVAYILQSLVKAMEN